MSAASDIHS